MESNIDLINFKGGLKKNQIINEIKTIVKEKFNKSLDLTKIKEHLVDLCKDILRHIKVLLNEKSFTLTDDEIKTLTLEIVQLLVALTNPEIELIKASINFIITNKLIKQISTSKRLKKIVSGIAKKLL
jgi:hypothetical protein